MSELNSCRSIFPEFVFGEGDDNWSEKLLQHLLRKIGRVLEKSLNYHAQEQGR